MRPLPITSPSQKLDFTHLIERRIIHDIILITLEHRHGRLCDPLHIGIDDERRVVRHRHVDAGGGIVLAQEEDVAASPAEPDGDDLVAAENQCMVGYSSRWSIISLWPEFWITVSSTSSTPQSVATPAHGTDLDRI